MGRKLKRKPPGELTLALEFPPSSAADIRELIRRSPKKDLQAIVAAALGHHLDALRLVASGGRVIHQDPDGQRFEVVIKVDTPKEDDTP